DNGQFYEEENETKKGYDKWGGDEGYNQGGIGRCTEKIPPYVSAIADRLTDAVRSWFGGKGGAPQSKCIYA
ncbi:hypothetical protein Tco_0621732, partial [Tanacetum coccineum]